MSKRNENSEIRGIITIVTYKNAMKHDLLFTIFVEFSGNVEKLLYRGVSVETRPVWVFENYSIIKSEYHSSA